MPALQGLGLPQRSPREGEHRACTVRATDASAPVPGVVEKYVVYFF